MGSADPAITYVVSRWGEPTQTFVRREAEAVAAAGVAVSVLSMKRPRECPSSLPVTWLGPIGIATGLIRAVIRHPRRVAAVLFGVAKRASPRNQAPLLLAALIGVAWVGARATRGGHLHVHFGWVSAAAAWSCATIEGDRFSVVLHAFELHTASRCDRFTSVPLAAAERVFTISALDADLVGRRWGVQAEVLRMGVPSEWVLDVRQAAVDPWLVVSVGSLTPKKGHDVLVQALGRCDRRWRLLIIGEGPERARLHAVVSALGLADRVDLAGARSEGEVREALDRAGVFALACRVTSSGDRDGIPVALIEAMARRVPVVSSDVSAISELVGGAGLLVPPDDDRALAAAIDSLIDPARRRDLGGRGCERVASGFLVEGSARRVAALAVGPAHLCDDEVDRLDG